MKCLLIQLFSPHFRFILKSSPFLLREFQTQKISEQTYLGSCSKLIQTLNDNTLCSVQGVLSITEISHRDIFLSILKFKKVIKYINLLMFLTILMRLAFPDPIYRKQWVYFSKLGRLTFQGTSCLNSCNKSFYLRGYVSIKYRRKEKSVCFLKLLKNLTLNVTNRSKQPEVLW